MFFCRPAKKRTVQEKYDAASRTMPSVRSEKNGIHDKKGAATQHFATLFCDLVAIIIIFALRQ